MLNKKNEIDEKKIIEILKEMHKYLYEVHIEECECNEGSLSWEEIEKYYRKLDEEYRYETKQR